MATTKFTVQMACCHDLHAGRPYHVGSVVLSQDAALVARQTQCCESLAAAGGDSPCCHGYKPAARRQPDSGKHAAPHPSPKAPAKTAPAPAKTPPASPSPPTPANKSAVGYVRAHNQYRSPALQYDSNLEIEARKVVEAMWSTCAVTQEAESIATSENHGVNTIAISGCSEPCPWAAAVNSWVAETELTACGITHRATALNPEASRVGCASKDSSTCWAAACVYDTQATTENALQIAASRPTPACNPTGACCGALPCRNTLC